jgi:alkaline phosphatase
LIHFEQRLKSRYPGANLVNGIEVVMGGGRRHFLPRDAAYNSPDAVSAIEGERTDGQDLISLWQSMYPNGRYVYDQNGFDAINPQSTERVLGLFNESHMQYEADRANDIAGEPSLTEMTQKAIDRLDNNRRGYFLMVEAGRIDHAHHAGSAVGALTDTVELSDAVARARALTSDSDTLIIVTADHSHVMTMAGYPKRGNPILGKVVNIGEDEPKLAADGAPYTTLSYANGRGFAELGAETNADVRYGLPVQGGRHLKHDTDTESPGYHQEALVPLSSETHGGDDVAIYASGPGAHLLSGSLEQNVIFHVMRYMADLPHPPADAEK